jgi:hypothetical protein
LVINVASGATVDFSDLTFAASGGDAFDNGADTITINGAAGNEIITATTLGATVSAGAGSDRVVIEAGTSATSWSVNLGAGDGAIDTIVFKHAGIDDGHDTAATVSNFAVANDRVAVNLAGIAITDGAFQTISGVNATVAAGTEVIELVNSSFVTASLTNDGNSASIEDIIAAASIDNIPTGDYTFIVYSSTNVTTANAGIYSVNISDNTNPGSSGMTVEHIMTLNGVGYGNLTAANFVAPGADPIVLDLDHNGVSFSSLGDGVSFDINADGAQDQIAWTANGGDGILALDLDGSGGIEAGNELFTPNFNGGNFADGIAALASLDGNQDGVIDSQDQAFGDLVVWRDANHDGVSDGGELVKLGDLGISSIDLATTPGAPIDGQNIAGMGSFTYADGSTGAFVEVDLDASLGAAPAPQQAGGDDAAQVAAAAADITVEFDHGEGNIDLSVLGTSGDRSPPPAAVAGLRGDGGFDGSRRHHAHA